MQFKLKMVDKLYNNADSFSMAFDEEWEKIKCEDKSKKIKKVIELLREHPFVISNPEMAEKIANFRINLLGKF
tara:strand:- start:603 stop:821 length:219 start_codon:yes stop_codon:yes gene_type:complete